MNKKHIIIALAGGLSSFAGAFVTMWLIGRTNAPAPVVTATTQQANEQIVPKTQGEEPDTEDFVPQRNEEPQSQKTLNDKQLKGLVFEVREKIRAYERKAKELEVREARLAITQETLKKDIDELNKMRVELAAIVANLKEERSKLLETRAQISQSEKANITSIAATYDKMDASSASKILSNMCEKQMGSGRLQGGAIDDAVKILYYMTERTKAKVLAEMVTSEPKLPAVLCQRLKEIVEYPTTP